MGFRKEELISLKHQRWRKYWKEFLKSREKDTSFIKSGEVDTRYVQALQKIRLDVSIACAMYATKYTIHLG